MNEISNFVLKFRNSYKWMPNEWANALNILNQYQISTMQYVRGSRILCRWYLSKSFQFFEIVKRWINEWTSIDHTAIYNQKAECFARNTKSILSISNLQNNMLQKNTTFRFSSIVYGLYTVHCSHFRYTESWNFRILNCASVKIQNQTASKYEAKTEKMTFLLASHQSTFVPERHAHSVTSY